MLVDSSVVPGSFVKGRVSGAVERRRRRNLFSLIRAGSELGFITTVLHYK